MAEEKGESAMSELTGTIHSTALSMDGKLLLTLQVNEYRDGAKTAQEFTGVPVAVKITKQTKKRSISANNLCWELCTKLAENQSKHGVMHTKEDIYRDAIKQVGIYKDFENLKPSDAKTLRHAWELLGTGWVTEQVDFMPDGENVIVRCYYGSSQYSRKQMSRLIDNLVQDCIACGVEHRPPEEVASILGRWGE
jgi:hypothetical protein